MYFTNNYPNRHQSGQAGFSLIEVIVVVSFLVILLSLSGSNLMWFGQDKILTQSAYELTAMIEDSRHQAASGESYQNDLVNVGIRLNSDGLTRFYTYSDYNNRLVDLDYIVSLPPQIKVEQFSLPGICEVSSDCLVFAKGTGVNSGLGTFVIRDVNTDQFKTLTIGTYGLVSLQ